MESFNRGFRRYVILNLIRSFGPISRTQLADVTGYRPATVGELVKALLDESLVVETGFFNSTEDEVRLYRITDVTLTRSFGQKLIGTGTIHCDSSDVTMQNFDIKNVKHPKKVKELLSKLVNESRLRNRVYTSERINGVPHEHEGELPPEHEHPDDPEH